YSRLPPPRLPVTEKTTGGFGGSDEGSMENGDGGDLEVLMGALYIRVPSILIASEGRKSVGSISNVSMKDTGGITRGKIRRY
ncbi:hypothetical protein PIB30_085305, partial [Stylosanthes scabra]|nr:hypothetical protein [Stylosanthes scabra]